MDPDNSWAATAGPRTPNTPSEGTAGPMDPYFNPCDVHDNKRDIPSYPLVI